MNSLIELFDWILFGLSSKSLCYIISNEAKTLLRSLSLKKYQTSEKLIDDASKTFNNFSVFINAKL